MATITLQHQDLLAVQHHCLDERESAEFLLSSAFGRILTEEWLQLIERGLSEYIDWHNKQHPDSTTCEYCEILKENLIMYKVVNHWSALFLARKPNTARDIKLTDEPVALP